MSVEARRATGAAIRRDIGDFAHRDTGRGRRATLPPGAARGMGRPRDRVVPAAAVAAGARSRRRGAARARRPAPALRLASVADGRSAGIEAVRTGAAPTAAAGLGPQPAVSRPVVSGRRRSRSSTCRTAARAQPRIGRWRRSTPCRGRADRRLASPGEDGFELATTIGRPARIGAAGPRSTPGRRRGSTWATTRWSICSRHARERHRPRAVRRRQCARGRERRRASGRCCSSATAELIAPGRYRLTRLLRGQRGTEGAIGSPAPAGARVVVLDEALAPLPVAEAATRAARQLALRAGVQARRRPILSPAGFTPEGVGLRPFSVGHVGQPWRTARGPAI